MSQWINLVVKATGTEAVRAAARRGVSAFWVTDIPSFSQARLRCHQDYEAKVREWFSEHSEAPYPEGALLLYTKQGRHLKRPVEK